MCRKALVFAAFIAIAPSMAGAQQWYNAAGGVSERSWISKSSAPSAFILFAWFPTLPTFSTLYFATANCSRSEDGEGVGKNKVTFRGVMLFGPGDEVMLSSRTGRMKKGEMRGGGPAWDITEVVRSTFSAEPQVIAGCEAVVGGRVGGFEELICRMEIVEILDPDALASASSEERLAFFRQVQRQERGGRVLP